MGNILQYVSDLDILLVNATNYIDGIDLISTFTSYLGYIRLFVGDILYLSMMTYFYVGLAFIGWRVGKSLIELIRLILPI